ncbi:MAG: hypothetical protein AVDCRST_MAG73-2292, partial [uncultured Thermomicrobiales bacterium]
ERPAAIGDHQAKPGQDRHGSPGNRATSLSCLPCPSRRRRAGGPGHRLRADPGARVAAEPRDRPSREGCPRAGSAERDRGPDRERSAALRRHPFGDAQDQLAGPENDERLDRRRDRDLDRPWLAARWDRLGVVPALRIDVV